MQRCLSLVLVWLRALRNLAAFKIGIAFEPEGRWNNDEFGYRTEKMWILIYGIYVGLTEDCRRLAIALIDKLKGVTVCYNETSLMRRGELHFIVRFHLLLLCRVCAGRRWRERAHLMEASATPIAFPPESEDGRRRVGPLFERVAGGRASRTSHHHLMSRP